MSMYADYIKERMGDEIIEREEGFATYRYVNSYEVYIIDIYVKPDFRKTNIASQMADEIAEIARKEGKVMMIGTVSSTAKNPTESIKVLLGYGMKFRSSNQDGIIFEKEM